MLCSCNTQTEPKEQVEHADLSRDARTTSETTSNLNSKLFINQILVLYYFLDMQCKTMCNVNFQSPLGTCESEKDCVFVLPCGQGMQVAQKDEILMDDDKFMLLLNYWNKAKQTPEPLIPV